MALEEGYGLVGPKTAEVAQALLAAAASMNEDASVVRTVIGGFYAPVRVVKRYEESLGAKPEPVAESAEKSDFPDDSWKNADIKQWATAHGVDLGEATKKADMLAAIAATDKEE